MAMIKWINILFLLLIMAFPAITMANINGQIDIREFSLKNTSNTYQYSVNARMRITLSEKFRIALLNGIKLEIKTIFSLGQHKTWWWDSLDNIKQIHYELKYHSLSKYYTVTNRSTNQFWNFSTLPRALQHLGVINNFILPVFPNEIENGHHYLFTMASIQPVTPNLPLKIQALLNNQYITKSEGILWALP